jgi:hypothetical protein
LKRLAHFRAALKSAGEVTVGREPVVRLLSRGERFAPMGAFK